MITKPDAFHTHDFTKIPPEEAYRWIVSLVVPRPIAWITTRDENNVINLAPFSFYNAISSFPPCVAFAITRKPHHGKKDTLLNIENNGEFTVNVPDEEHAKLVNDTSADLPYGESELKKYGLESIPGTFTQVPRVASVKAAFECRVEKIIEIGDGVLGSSTLVIGRILGVHVADSIVVSGKVQVDKLKPISRLGGALWAKVSGIFEQKRPTSN